MKIKRFQEGGMVEAAPEAGAPQEDQMMQQLAQMAQEIIQQLGPDAAMMLAQIIAEMLQQGAAPEAGAAPEEQGQPVFRKGGVIAYRCGGISSKKCGGKAKKGCKKC